LIGTNADAFLASLAGLRKIDANVTMPEQDDFPEDLLGARFHAFPAGLAAFGVDFDVLRTHMSWKRKVKS
jgi:hypothetical protein